MNKYQINKPLRYFLFILLFFLYIAALGYLAQARKAALSSTSTETFNEMIRTGQAHSLADISKTIRHGEEYARGVALSGAIINVFFAGAGVSIWYFTRKKINNK